MGAIRAAGRGLGILTHLALLCYLGAIARADISCSTPWEADSVPPSGVAVAGNAAEQCDLLVQCLTPGINYLFIKQTVGSPNTYQLTLADGSTAVLGPMPAHTRSAVAVTSIATIMPGSTDWVGCLQVPCRWNTSSLPVDLADWVLLDKVKIFSKGEQTLGDPDAVALGETCTAMVTCATGNPSVTLKSLAVVPGVGTTVTPTGFRTLLPLAVSAALPAVAPMAFPHQHDPRDFKTQLSLGIFPTDADGGDTVSTLFVSLSLEFTGGTAFYNFSHYPVTVTSICLPTRCAAPVFLAPTVSVRPVAVPAKARIEMVMADTENGICRPSFDCPGTRQAYFVLETSSACATLDWSACSSRLPSGLPLFELMNNRTSAYCSYANGTFMPKMIQAPNTTETFYPWCTASAVANCLPICNSPNFTDASTHWYEVPSPPGQIFVLSDADGEGSATYMGQDTACTYPARCRDTSQFVTFNITGTLDKVVNMWWDFPTADGSDLKATTLAALRPEVEATLDGPLDLIGLVVPFPSNIGTMSYFAARQAPGFTAKIQCLHEPAITCTRQPPFSWAGTPVTLKYSGLIPFLDTCSYQFTCPLGMYAGVRLDVDGGYLYQDKYVIQRVQLFEESANINPMALLSAAPGCVFSNDHHAYLTWFMQGLRNPQLGGYNLTFDCYTAACPTNGTTVKANITNGTWELITDERAGAAAANRATTWSIVNSRCVYEVQCKEASETLAFSMSVQQTQPWIDTGVVHPNSTIASRLTKGSVIQDVLRTAPQQRYNGRLQFVGGPPDSARGSANYTFWPEYDMTWGIFVRSRNGTVRWKSLSLFRAPSSLAGTEREPLSLAFARLDLYARCYAMPCSINDTLLAPNRTAASTLRTRVDELRTYRDFLNEECVFRLQCPRWGNATARYMSAEIKTRLLGDDAVNATSEADGERVGSLRPWDFYGELLGIGSTTPVAMARLFNGTALWITLSTFEASHPSTPVSYPWNVFAPLEVMCFVDRCGNNLTNPSVGGERLESSLLHRPAGSSLRSRPGLHGEYCEWVVECNSTHPYGAAQYDVLLEGNGLGFTVGNRTFASPHVRQRYRGAFMGTADALTVTFQTRMYDHRDAELLYNAVWNTGTKFVPAIYDRGYVVRPAIYHTDYYGGEDTGADVQFLCLPSRCRHDLQPRAPNASHGEAVSEVSYVPEPGPPRSDGARMLNSFFQYERCEVALTCDSGVLRVPLTTVRGTVATLWNAGEDAVGQVITRPLSWSELTLTNQSFDAASSSWVDDAVVEQGTGGFASNRWSARAFSASGSRLRLRFEPTDTGAANFTLFLFCYFAPCCVNATQDPIVIDAGSAVSLRTPSAMLPFVSVPCGTTTVNQRCRWRVDPCTTDPLGVPVGVGVMTTPVALFPANGATVVVDPAVGDAALALLGPGGIAAPVPGRSITVEYGYYGRASDAVFPGDAAVAASCVKCNGTAITTSGVEPSPDALLGNGTVVELWGAVGVPMTCTVGFSCADATARSLIRLRDSSRYTAVSTVVAVRPRSASGGTASNESKWLRVLRPVNPSRPAWLAPGAEAVMDVASTVVTTPWNQYAVPLAMEHLCVRQSCFTTTTVMDRSGAAIQRTQGGSSAATAVIVPVSGAAEFPFTNVGNEKCCFRFDGNCTGFRCAALGSILQAADDATSATVRDAIAKANAGTLSAGTYWYGGVTAVGRRLGSQFAADPMPAPVVFSFRENAGVELCITKNDLGMLTTASFPPLLLSLRTHTQTFTLSRTRSHTRLRSSTRSERESASISASLTRFETYTRSTERTRSASESMDRTASLSRPRTHSLTASPTPPKGTLSATLSRSLSRTASVYPRPSVVFEPATALVAELAKGARLRLVARVLGTTFHPSVRFDATRVPLIDGGWPGDSPGVRTLQQRVYAAMNVTTAPGYQRTIQGFEGRRYRLFVAASVRAVNETFAVIDLLPTPMYRPTRDDAVHFTFDRSLFTHQQHGVGPAQLVVRVAASSSLNDLVIATQQWSPLATSFVLSSSPRAALANKFLLRLVNGQCGFVLDQELPLYSYPVGIVELGAGPLRYIAASAVVNYLTGGAFIALHWCLAHMHHVLGRVRTAEAQAALQFPAVGILPWLFLLSDSLSACVTVFALINSDAVVAADFAPQESWVLYPTIGAFVVWLGTCVATGCHAWWTFDAVLRVTGDADAPPRDVRERVKRFFRGYSEWDHPTPFEVSICRARHRDGIPRSTFSRGRWGRHFEGYTKPWGFAFVVFETGVLIALSVISGALGNSGSCINVAIGTAIIFVVYTLGLYLSGAYLTKFDSLFSVAAITLQFGAALAILLSLLQGDTPSGRSLMLVAASLATMTSFLSIFKAVFDITVIIVDKCEEFHDAAVTDVPDPFSVPPTSPAFRHHGGPAGSSQPQVPGSRVDRSVAAPRGSRLDVTGTGGGVLSLPLLQGARGNPIAEHPSSLVKGYGLNISAVGGGRSASGSGTAATNSSRDINGDHADALIDEFAKPSLTSPVLAAQDLAQLPAWRRDAHSPADRSASRSRSASRLERHMDALIDDFADPSPGANSHVAAAARNRRRRVAARDWRNSSDDEDRVAAAVARAAASERRREQLAARQSTITVPSGQSVSRRDYALL